MEIPVEVLDNYLHSRRALSRPPEYSLLGARQCVVAARPPVTFSGAGQPQLRLWIIMLKMGIMKLDVCVEKSLTRLGCNSGSMGIAASLPPYAQVVWPEIASHTVTVVRPGGHCWPPLTLWVGQKDRLTATIRALRTAPNRARSKGRSPKAWLTRRWRFVQSTWPRERSAHSSAPLRRLPSASIPLGVRALAVGGRRSDRLRLKRGTGRRSGTDGESDGPRKPPRCHSQWCTGSPHAATPGWGDQSTEVPMMYPTWLTAPSPPSPGPLVPWLRPVQDAASTSAGGRARPVRRARAPGMLHEQSGPLSSHAAC